MSATAFYIPSRSKTTDVSVLEQQISTLKADIAPMKADLASATPASTGVGGTLVRRDANKDFEASKVKLWHLEAAGPVLNIGNDNQTQTLNIGNGSAVQTINMGNSGTGVTTLNLGGGSDQVKVNLPLKNSTGANILQVSAYTTPGQANVAVGSNVLPSNGANGNTMVGSDIAVDGTMNGGYNTGMGSIAMQGLTSGVGNSGYGHRALNSVTTGGHNVGVGFRAGSEPNDMTKSLTTGSRNTLIGADTRTASNAQFNSTALGNGAVVDADNTIQLGNNNIIAVKTAGTLVAAGLESTGTTLNIASQNNTNVVNIGSGTAVQTINMGNSGTGATNINLGAGSDVVNLGRTNCSSLFSFGQQNKDKTLALYNSNSADPNNPNDHRYYGFGVADGGVAVPQETGSGGQLNRLFALKKILK